MAPRDSSPCAEVSATPRWPGCRPELNPGADLDSAARLRAPFVARDRSAVARPSDCGPAQPGSIWTVASNGRGLRHIGPPDPSGPIWASWSPRGRQVAIESVNSDCAYSGSIDIFDPNATRFRAAS